ncbi:unnamed protein product, partial [Mesorhabditis spiculigera]
MASNETVPLIFPIVYTTALTIGSVSVTFFLLILIYGRKTFNEAPFYQIIYCLVVVDLLHLLQHWIQIFPQQIFGWGGFPFSEWLQDSVIVFNHSLNSLVFLSMNHTVKTVLKSMPCFRKAKRNRSGSQPLSLSMRF